MHVGANLLHMRRHSGRLVSATWHGSAPSRPCHHTSRSNRPKYAEPSAPSAHELHADATSRTWDAIVVGGGHNGLTAAAYLARAGCSVLVLERRHVLGGACVTEPLAPGYLMSRGAYLAGLMRPSIVRELQLERHGFHYLTRSPSSFTPADPERDPTGPSLVLGASPEADAASIGQFSAADADAYQHYEAFLERVRDVMQPLLEGTPPNPWASGRPATERMRALRRLTDLAKVGWRHRRHVSSMYDLFTGPADQLLARFFESDMLRTTLAIDAVIGALQAPSTPGSAYLLLHHVMGEAAGRRGVWAYMRGGMGAVSQALAAAAREAGAEIATEAMVQGITYEAHKGRHGDDARHADIHATVSPPGGYRATGVRLLDGTALRAHSVLSNATPQHTFLELLPGGDRMQASPLPEPFVRHIRNLDYRGGSLKINLALNALPNFTCAPTSPDGQPGPQHVGTIHFETRMQQLETAYAEAIAGMPATRPVIELTLPSVLDNTLAPPGHHVANLFVQQAPYDVHPAHGAWDDGRLKPAFTERVLNIVEQHCPGFKASIVAMDVLSPLDLEHVFGLHRGSITHQGLGMHQLAYHRPAPGWSDARTPMTGLYLAGAGAHPGGGVMGLAGRNAARAVLADLGQM